MDIQEMKFDKVELLNVLVKKTRTTENITVDVVPFDRFNDAHVEFAYAYSDMLYRAPSSFKTVDDTSRAYAKLFVVHEQDEEKVETSTLYKVLNDLRACRTLFNQEKITSDIVNFFENA